MRAAVFEKVGVLTIKEIERPLISTPNDIIVKVELCSICGTDVHIMTVPPGYIATPGTVLGHELVGRVVEIGDEVTTLKIGDRVVCNPNDYCGICCYCKMGYPNHCENIKAMGIDVDGGFAEYVRLSEKVSFKIPDDLPAEIAAFAEPLACAVNGMKKIRANPGESVVIIGGGTIGLMFCQLMKASGAYPIIVSEPSVLRREFALKSGADYVVDPVTQDLDAQVKLITGVGADFAIDVVGSQVQSCITVVRKGGTVLVFGVNSHATQQIKQVNITQKEVSVLGTWLANSTFPKAVHILASGKLNLKELITDTLPLEDTLIGIEKLKKGDGVEIFIDPCL